MLGRLIISPKTFSTVTTDSCRDFSELYYFDMACNEMIRIYFSEHHECYVHIMLMPRIENITMFGRFSETSKIFLYFFRDKN